MNRIIVMLGISSVVLLCYCTSSRKTAIPMPLSPPDKPAVPITYDKHIAPLLTSYCMPCHFPETDGKDAYLDNYDTVRALVNDILYRIELQPHERGFMPEKDKRLPDSTIQLFHRWKKQGLVK